MTKADRQGAIAHSHGGRSSYQELSDAKKVAEVWRFSSSETIAETSSPLKPAFPPGAVML
jgi:hypothetical protein